MSVTASISAKEIPNYGDISIKAEHVTLNKFTNNLLLKTNIQIKKHERNFKLLIIAIYMIPDSSN